MLLLQCMDLRRGPLRREAIRIACVDAAHERPHGVVEHLLAQASAYERGDRLLRVGVRRTHPGLAQYTELGAHREERGLQEPERTGGQRHQAVVLPEIATLRLRVGRDLRRAQPASVDQRGDVRVVLEDRVRAELEEPVAVAVRDDGPAYPLPGLQERDLEALLRQQGGRGEARDPASDHDHVECPGAHRLPPGARASGPGAPHVTGRRRESGADLYSMAHRGFARGIWPCADFFSCYRSSSEPLLRRRRKSAHAGAG